MLQFNKIGGGLVALIPSAIQALETLGEGSTLAVVAGHAVQLAHDFEDVFAAVENVIGAGGGNGGNGNGGGNTGPVRATTSTGAKS